MFNLFNTTSKHQLFARQHNCNLVEANGFWHLYQDGKLVAREKHPANANQYITNNL